MSMFRTLLGYLKPYKFLFFLGLFLVGLASAMELLKPWPLKLAVDQIIGQKPLVVFGWTPDLGAMTLGVKLACVVGMLVGVHFLVGFVQLCNNYLTIRMGQDMVQDLRCDLFDHLQRQSLLFHQKWPTGDLIYRIMGDTYAVQTLLMNGVFTTLTSSALLIGMLAVCLQMDVELTLYALCVIPFLFLAISRVSRKIGDLTTETHMKESQVYTTVERIFSSITLVQAFGREEEERRKFVAESKHSFDRKLSLYALQTVYGWLVSGITAAGTALVLYIGVRHVLEGLLSTGELLVFIAYLASLYTPLNSLSDTVAGIRASLARARRVMDVLAVDEAVPEREGAPDLAISAGEVRFEDVSFGYTPEKMVLNDVTFTCRGNSTVAIVGQTGAGKTSLISLLLRFYDPRKGAIVIDGQDLRDVSLKSLRRHIAIVLQETQLFPMTVHDNIAYGKKQASREEVERVAMLANAHDFIKELPKGYDTILGEKGANLSGGQRQRLAIARALLKDAPLLILDEPTSALDAETEALIMEGLDRLMQNRTTFVIAHRLSMMRRADMILVIKNQRIHEMGSYDELMAKNGEFARLHAIQMGKGRPEKLPPKPLVA
ncbi:Xenobiotic-transporting ATPase [Solidesulfovibrio carbinoliphilus subsp. oakridgensis]|uniref:Xenobiotic-transporting ATPase n=1 Tax=Solidesulfovibrio carbinoliphilus subsp. oakridgensis TaxID=694327 RepID=G7QAN8_9BACT|nr:ABC transporter ATP-binding protein [Solidesulfovibrio carbinoliphilus]EHJ49269.1 Xenobiotic-transporting ATPase [Solidesulfovibrio carbinoliphilus subsp. oakridgensis]